MPGIADQSVRSLGKADCYGRHDEERLCAKAKAPSVRIVDIREITKADPSPIARLYRFFKDDDDLVAVVTDTLRDGKPVVATASFERPLWAGRADPRALAPRLMEADPKTCSINRRQSRIRTGWRR